MISFKDKTFCSASCLNVSCHRNVTEEVKAEGTEWWGSPEFPIALHDYSTKCTEYQPKGNESEPSSI